MIRNTVFQNSDTEMFNIEDSLFRILNTHLSIFQHHMSVSDDILRHSMTNHALEYVEVDSLVMSLGWDCPCGFRIPDDQICIRSHCYSSLKIDR